MYSRGKTEWFVQEAFQQMLEKYHLKEKYIEQKIIYSWKTLVGNMIHKHTKKITLKNKILTIIIDSPIVKNELRMLRTELLLRIKENVPLVDIDEIIIK
jgi:predicted nucleic acid-binding Zn ribbon protein